MLKGFCWLTVAGAVPDSNRLPEHLEPAQFTSLVAVRVQSKFAVVTGTQLHVDRPAADRAIFDVLGIAAGTVNERFEALAAERATDGQAVEHAFRPRDVSW